MTIEQALIGINSDGPVGVGATITPTARSILPGRLHAIIVDAETARCFELARLNYGSDSIFINACPIALSMFATQMPRWPNAWEIAREQDVAELPRLWTSAVFLAGHDIKLELCNRYGDSPADFRGALVVTVLEDNEPVLWGSDGS